MLPGTDPLVTLENKYSSVSIREFLYITKPHLQEMRELGNVYILEKSQCHWPGERIECQSRSGHSVVINEWVQERNHNSKFSAPSNTALSSCTCLVGKGVSGKNLLIFFASLRFSALPPKLHLLSFYLIMKICSFSWTIMPLKNQRERN
jgi:hypothetical protein